jgi:hypothetical protein
MAMKNTKNKIEFNEALHEYRVGGILTPSVSQILKANGLMESFRHNPTALNNGTAIHRALELHDLGKLDESSLDKRLEKCIQLWEKFKKEIGVICVLGAEERVCFGVMYAGTIDRILSLNSGKKMILDFKSGSPQPWAALQTAGYAMAYDITNHKEYERCCAKVHWDMDRIVYKPYKDHADFNSFMAMATVFHWKKNNGYLREEEKYVS